MSEIVILLGLGLLLATIAGQVQADPWIAVAVIAIGAAVKCVALYRGTYEDDAKD